MRVLAFLAVVSLSYPAWGQSHVLDPSGASPGKYYFVVTVAADGSSTLRRVTNVYSLGSPPSPGNPEGPTPGAIPQLPEGFARQVQEWALAVPDPNRAENAERLALVYDAAADEESLPMSGLFPFVKESSNRLLGDSVAAWQPFRDAVSAHLSKEMRAGRLQEREEYVAVLRDVAAGLRSSTTAALRPELRQFIRDVLLPLILKLVLGQS